MALLGGGARNRRTAARKQTEQESKPARWEPGPWCPSTYTAMQILVSARMCAALWSNIQDCDETFNYWEPTHYLAYGRGLQTWEYAPQYALRSYAYLLLHALPARLLTPLLHADRLLVFYALRCLLALSCAAAEAYFYCGVRRAYGAVAARLTLAFLTLSAGMFIASAAYLPSSFAMYMTLVAAGAWLRERFPLAILATATGALLGWPFAALLGIPIVWDVAVRRRRPWVFIRWSLISLFVLLVPITCVDSFMYGRLVCAPLNIVMYNVFSSGGGAQLYGTEPASFYLVNLVLNFSFAAPLAVLALPLCLLRAPRTAVGAPPAWLVLMAPLLWAAVFVPQAHKEERFLYPAYPYLCLSAALALQRLLSALPGRCQVAELAAVVLFGVLGVSRGAALHLGYHAPLDTFAELVRLAETQLRQPPPFAPVTVCTGREWHRFPSSFLLPSSGDWRLGLLASEFRGQLPQYFPEHENGTREVRAHFNDQNREEPAGRYVSEAECHFLVDLDLPAVGREHAYSRQRERWHVLKTHRFLDAARSPRLLRAFYVPWFTETRCQYIDYNLLVSVQWRNKLFPSKGGDR